ncbi:DMT family transporter [Mucilaginibacter daejeonensis]|uniref:DMT family transporter n=1 Tax=Mucilaginibacter daejeonensis TaxID=398049 RepID=UPI001D172922|nr:EamA family transporter [Mucilaginibacter daejeonensis]UEG52345.1 DMT family transporter [Mucilaginibacter daejeonensis]
MSSSQNASAQLNKNLLILHFTVFIWGFTGILGNLITMTAVNLVWYRVLIAFATLFLYFKFNKKHFSIDRSTFLKLILTGALVGGHWILFFQAIKVSNVSITLVCLSSTTLFTAIFEPLINRKPISKLEILSGILIIIGIVLIFKFETQYTLGITLGLLCASASSLFSIINSRQVKTTHPTIISFYELIGAFFWITIYMLLSGTFTDLQIPQGEDIGYLIILGTICTSLAYVAGVSVMRELSAFKVALITNLEPVYGIVMAFMFFGDLHTMSIGFWAGAVVILSTIFLFPVVQRNIGRLKNR